MLQPICKYSTDRLKWNISPINLIIKFLLISRATDKSINWNRLHIWTYSVCYPIRHWRYCKRLSRKSASINFIIQPLLDRRLAVVAHLFGVFAHATNTINISSTFTAQSYLHLYSNPITHLLEIYFCSSSRRKIDRKIFRIKTCSSLYGKCI